MLAQNFKSAIDLGISEAQKEALIKTLVLLETDKLTHVKKYGSLLANFDRKFTGHFNMAVWNATVPRCGTVCCIGGTAEIVGDVKFNDYIVGTNRELYRLLYPTVVFSMRSITPQEAAQALRNYLTNGKSDWDSILE